MHHIKIKLLSEKEKKKGVDFAYNFIWYITVLQFKATTRRPQEDSPRSLWET